MTRLCPKSRRMYLLALILSSILTGTCGKALADNNKTTGQAKVGKRHPIHSQHRLLLLAKSTSGD
ncbi:MAG: hypothetical protein IPL73_22065 [Candidatus Obscuribacter sp.]|nr:hypothetical protein [Candidatus Obscuribacter sp.]